VKRLIGLGLACAFMTLIMGCQSTEVSDGDAKSFGKESEADRAAKAEGTYSDSREDR